MASRRRRPLAAIDLPAARTRRADLVAVGDEVGRDVTFVTVALKRRLKNEWKYSTRSPTA